MDKAASSGSCKSVGVEEVPDTVDSDSDGDRLTQFEKRVWWKLDLSVLCILTIVYLLSWLDRTNIGNARVAGFQEALHLSNDQYSIALTITLIPFLAAELPVSLLLKIVGPDVLLPAMLTLWGVVTTLQGTVQTYRDLLACRFFIGLFEGGLPPGIILYTSIFYPRSRLQLRLSIIFSAASLAGTFSGLLAAAITNMDGIGGRPGWAWIFILEGLFTVLVGISAFFLVPRSPMYCSLLDLREREYVLQCLRDDGAISYDESCDVFCWKEVAKTFKLPHVWLIMALSAFNGLILYSMSYFTPSIVQGLVHNPSRAQLLSVPPYAVAFMVTNVASYIADRHQCRGLVLIFCAACCTSGFAIFLASHDSRVQYGSLFLAVSGINTVSPAFTAWVANNVSPHTRRATAIAAVCVMTNLGGILSTWLLGSLSAPPRYTLATIVLLAGSIGLGVSATINVVYLRRQNTKKAAVRASLTKEEEPDGLGDQSAWFVCIL